MNKAKHCALCENQTIDIMQGTKCALTNEKPAFAKTCAEIVFNEKLENVVNETNLEYNKVLKTKTAALLQLGTYLVIGCAFILIGYVIGKYAIDKGVISTVPLIIMGVGVLVIPFAFGALNKYRMAFGVAREKKDTLDKILKLYNVNYVFSISFGKVYHGKQEIKTDLKIDKLKFNA